LSAVPSAFAGTTSVLRIGMPLLPSTLDPARADNAQAFMVMAGIYDTLYAFDPVARSTAIVPLAAAAPPEVAADYRTLTIRIRPGIFFAPHASFGGRPRELTAADFAYAARRVLDPTVRSPGLYMLEGKIEGLDALAAKARDAGRALDYDAPVAGLVVVDRFTLRIRLNAPDPFFQFMLTSPLLAGVAREVVEAEGDAYGQRPVGTGGFFVAAFTPGQRLTLARNTNFRSLRFEDLLTPASRAAAAAHPMRGRTLPAVARIELTSTPEYSAELLALRQGELDLIHLGAPGLAIANGKLKEEFARAGLKLVRDPSPIALLSFFSMRDPVVGGDSRDRIALRRAILMAFDDDEWIRVVDGGFSTKREQLIPPGIEGHVTGYRSPNRYDPAAANALLDRFGYARGPDGFRRRPDGAALTVPALIGTSSEARKQAEFMKRMLDRIGIRVAFEAAPAGERLKRMSQCAFGMTTMDLGLGAPDGTDLMSNFYGKAIGSANSSCYADPVFDAAYEKALVTPPGSARTELFRTMQSQLDAYAPARPLPFGDMLLLKRRHVIGPFGTIGDWMQLMTLAVDDKSAAPSR
jgi:ABC-type transport system substrate-binding protein